MRPHPATMVGAPVDDALARLGVDPSDSGYGWMMFPRLHRRGPACHLHGLRARGRRVVVDARLPVVIHVNVTGIVIRVVYGAFASSADSEDDSVERPPRTMRSGQPIRGGPVAHH